MAKNTRVNIPFVIVYVLRPDARATEGPVQPFSPAVVTAGYIKQTKTL